MTQGFIPLRLSETAQTYLCQDKRRKISLQRKEKEKSSLIDKKKSMRRTQMYLLFKSSGLIAKSIYLDLFYEIVLWWNDFPQAYLLQLPIFFNYQTLRAT